MGLGDAEVSQEQRHGLWHGGPLACIFADQDHSEREPREIIVGYSARGRLLVVSFTERVEVVRLISARVATRREHRRHEENRKA